MRKKIFLLAPRPQTILVWERDYSYTRSCVNEEVYVRTYVWPLSLYSTSGRPSRTPVYLRSPACSCVIRTRVHVAEVRVRGDECVRTCEKKAKFYSKAIS